MLRAVALATQAQIGINDLPEKLREPRPAKNTFPLSDVSELVPLDELIHRYRLHGLNLRDGTQDRAAQTVGMEDSAFSRPSDRPTEDP